MRLFAIGDTHLPSTRGKDMDRFGWNDHPRPLQRAWDSLVTSDDAVLVVGDISWATRATEVEGDLRWIDERPGKKVFVKGNHDFWWGDSASKLRKTLAPFPSIVAFVQNAAVEIGPYLIAGSRLWSTPEAPPMPGGEMGDEEVSTDYVERERNRLSLSIEDAKKKAKANPSLRKVVAVHFPPLYSNVKPTAFSAVIEEWKPEVCVYGHLHGEGIAAGFQGEHGGVRYVLASCDAAKFSPLQLLSP